MTAPPTWRDLTRRAARLGVTLSNDEHIARVIEGGCTVFHFATWLGRRADARILRMAVDAALREMERGR